MNKVESITNVMFAMVVTKLVLPEGYQITILLLESCKFTC